MCGHDASETNDNKTFYMNELLSELSRYTAEAKAAIREREAEKAKKSARVGALSTATEPQNHTVEEDHLFKAPADETLLVRKPWLSDPYYFKTVHISAIALLKMVTHARSGGSIEIMGMLTGKVMGPHEMVVLDTYPLPVEGTETRVNAQNEGYEFMVQHLENMKRIGKEENIIGWYHSHPGYGCWLSGIDVATQALNQGFQDPYVAIVVDPERTFKQAKVEIGAFRALPESVSNAPKTNRATPRVPSGKQEEFGVHAKKYYSLDVKMFTSSNDDRVLKALESKYLFSDILSESEPLTDRERTELIDNVDKITSRLGNMLPQSAAKPSGAGMLEESYLSEMASVLGGEMPVKRRVRLREAEKAKPRAREENSLQSLTRDFQLLTQSSLSSVLSKNVQQQLFQ